MEASGVLSLLSAASMSTTAAVHGVIARRTCVTPAPIIFVTRTVTSIVTARISTTVAATVAATRVTFRTVGAVLAVRRITVLASTGAVAAVPVTATARVTVIVSGHAAFVVPAVFAVTRRAVGAV